MHGLFKIFYARATCRFLEPIILGEYPREMREILGQDLPPLPYDLQKLKPATDFIGINHYTSCFVKDCIHSVCEPGQGSTRTEGFALTLPEMNGTSIGEPVCVYETLYIAFLDRRPCTFNLKKHVNHMDFMHADCT